MATLMQLRELWCFLRSLVYVIGGDLKYEYGSTQFNTAREVWIRDGRAKAVAIIQSLASTPSPPSPSAPATNRSKL
jgi:hypothetical protein